MDELEFRRQAYADPHQKDPEFLAAVAQTSSRTEFVQQLQEIDKSLQRTIKVPVPDDLAERLLLRQNLQVHQQQKKRHYWQLATAASFAFAIGLSLAVFQTQTPDLGSHDLGSHALAHVNHEIELLRTDINEQVDLRALNLKLASIGGQFEQLPGQIYYANYCDFDGIKSLHVIMSSAEGKVSLFMIPKQTKLDLPKQFADQRYHGIGEDRGQVHIAIVGERNQDLGQAMQQIESQFKPL